MIGILALASLLPSLAYIMAFGATFFRYRDLKSSIDIRGSYIFFVLLFSLLLFILCWYARIYLVGAMGSDSDDPYDDLALYFWINAATPILAWIVVCRLWHRLSNEAKRE
ncbi:hypothetical protein [Coralliovum pocilloporae]|uniref:hypothetical protein n=1 Tax=Coralliovum pocilloporae TaxID=3066369 RepID=UPI003306F6CC